VTGTAGRRYRKTGTVFIAWAYKNQDVKVVQKKLTGNRHQIRRQTVKIALVGVEL
jgi:nicotinamide mononucleotide (NMN) deamidase PncC